MHRQLVEKRRWVSDGRFLHALNYCMILPGPEAQQLAIYIGWLLHRVWGGIAAGVLFVVPGALLMWLISLVYVRYGEVPFIAAVFYGLKPAVMAIVVITSVLKSWMTLTMLHKKLGDSALPGACWAGKCHGHFYCREQKSLLRVPPHRSPVI